MEEVLALLPTDEGGLKKISKNSLVVLHGMLSWHGCPELRHLAFVALMRLGRQAPTLFRKDDDPAQDATAGMGCHKRGRLCYFLTAQPLSDVWSQSIWASVGHKQSQQWMHRESYQAIEAFMKDSTTQFSDVHEQLLP